MYLVRDIMHCKPGQVRPMLEKFKSMNAVMKNMGIRPFRLMTDVTGERFWTIVAEIEVEKLDGFMELMGKVMGNDEARKIMSGYHELAEMGRREIYTLEA